MENGRLKLALLFILILQPGLGSEPHYYTRTDSYPNVELEATHMIDLSAHRLLNDEEEISTEGTAPDIEVIDLQAYRHFNATHRGRVADNASCEQCPPLIDLSRRVISIHPDLEMPSILPDVSELEVVDLALFRSRRRRSRG